MPTPTPTPTPTQVPDAHLSVVLDTTGGAAVAGEELRIDFTVTNETPGPAFGVTLAFGANEPNRFVTARPARGTCEESTCDLGSFDGYESVSGHVVVLTKLGFDPEVRVDADLSWLLANTNSRHSYAEAKALLANSNQPGALVWATSIQASSMGCGDSAEVDAETVYAGFGKKLYAVSRSSGEVLWLKDGDSRMFEPVLANGSIYFHATETETRRKYVGSMNASKGTLTWQYLVKEEGAARGPVAVYGGSVYITGNHWAVDSSSSDYSYLMSLDASTGILNWQYRVDGLINTSAVEFGGNIYFGTYGGYDYLYSINPRSGELSRRYRTEGGSYYTPLITDETAYILSGWGALYSMDLSTGKKDWEYLPEGRAAGELLLSDGNVYLRVYDGEAGQYLSVEALDAATGSLEWQYKPGEELGQPTAANGSIYVPSYDNLVSLDALTGSLEWQAGYGSICGPMTAVDGVLYGRAAHNKRFIIFAIRGR